jgi:hypothetical protein
MLRRWVLLRHESPKVIKEKEPLKKKGSIDYFGLMNLSLASCSPAELASVSIQQGKNQFEKLYFKTVEKADQIHIQYLIVFLLEQCGFHFSPSFM